MSHLKDQFVNTEYGDLPIILSSPHGGNRITFNDKGKVIKPPLRPETKPDKYPYNYNIAPDSKTNYLTQKIANQIKHLSRGQRPYQIKAFFSRKVVDANRPLEYAVPTGKDINNSFNKQIYRTYHQELQKMIKNIERKFPGQPIWLFDIHGYSSAEADRLRSLKTKPDMTILVGTKEGKTLNNIDVPTLKKNLFTPLRDKLSVWLPQLGLDFPKVKQAFSGGHIVNHYSQSPYKVNGIQMEFGHLLRLNDKLRRVVGLATGEAIHEFYNKLVESQTRAKTETKETKSEKRRATH